MGTSRMPFSSNTGDGGDDRPSPWGHTTQVRGCRQACGLATRDDGACDSGTDRVLWCGVRPFRATGWTGTGTNEPQTHLDGAGEDRCIHFLLAGDVLQAKGLSPLVPLTLGI